MAAQLDSAAPHPETPAYTTLERLREHHCHDFAIFRMPNRYHIDVIRQLEAAGVPRLKGKPIAGTVDEFLELCSVQTNIGVTFQRRWKPIQPFLVVAFRKRDRAAALGAAAMAGECDPRKDGWRVQHNDELGVHMLDVLVWLLGRPSSDFAYCMSDGDPQGTRPRVARLNELAKSELVGHLYISEVAFEKEEGLAVRGTRDLCI